MPNEQFEKYAVKTAAPTNRLLGKNEKNSGQATVVANFSKYFDLPPLYAIISLNWYFTKESL